MQNLTPAAAAGPTARPARKATAAASGADPTPVGDRLVVGRQLRHHRRRAGRTLADVAAAAGISPSALSLIETGKREARLGVLVALAGSLGVGLTDLLTAAAPTRRASLEIELERAQTLAAAQGRRVPSVRRLGRLPLDALEALVGLHRSLAEVDAARSATPEEARRANADLRRRMREQDNYFPEIEAAAADLLRSTGYTAGPVTRAMVDTMAAHLGFALVHTADLPESTRTVTDLDGRRVYLPQPGVGQNDSRSLALQALGHIVLGHEPPVDYADFLGQRVEVNCFAAALLVPEQAAVAALHRAKAAKDIAIEDLRDAYAVSYEMSAHRFTNLATRHLDLPVHFMRVSSSGIVLKAYENDGVRFPSDATGAVEGRRVCRYWTARAVFNQPDLSSAYQQYTDTGSGTYWCTAVVDQTASGTFSVSVGVPFASVKWMRGRETPHRSASRCPDPDCCSRPPADLVERWGSAARPSARVQSHLLAAMPLGVFPGVDETDVMRFLESHTAPAAHAAPTATP